MVFITNLAPFKEFAQLTRSRRADFLLLSDSNTIFGGHGQDHGISYALSRRVPLYRTGLLSFNESGGGGNNCGYFCYHANNGGRTQTTPIAVVPAYDDILPAGDAFFPHKYWHMTDAQSDANNQGMSVNPGGPWDVNAQMRYRLTWHTFNVGVTGLVRPQVRLGASPYTTYVEAPATIETVTGSLSTVDYSLTLSAGIRNNNIDGRLCKAGTTCQGPVFATWQHFDWPDITAGASSNVIGYYGGQGLREFYNRQQATQTAWTEYFRQLQIAQGASPKACIVISSGLNDRGDAGLSVLSGLVSSTAAGYLDNLSGLIEFYQGVWGGAGLPSTDLYFLLLCSHPVSSPDDSQLVSYRQQCADATSTYSNVTAVDMSEFNPQLQANRTAWYNSAGTDPNHMTQAGYEGFYDLVFGQLLDKALGGSGSFRDRGRQRLLGDCR